MTAATDVGPLEGRGGNVPPAVRAVAMYPGLLLRAVELSRGNVARAEDLVQDAFEACTRTPPAAETDLELLHWMRQVIFNLNARAFRRDPEGLGI